MDDFKINITVVGLGLIGASMASALKKLQPRNIWGIDVDKDTIKKAENMGIIDKGYLNPEIPLKESDLVITAIYPRQTIAFIKENINNFKKGAIITDTAGIKNELIERIEQILPENIDFIGGHPMAGSEEKGIEQAKHDMFCSCNYILTPLKSSKASNINFLTKLIKVIGAKTVKVLDANTHDNMIAYTSQLPHVIAISLMNGFNIDGLDFIGGSFKDATRVACINEELWSELLLDNSKNIIEVIEAFEGNIKRIKEIIKDGDIENLKGKMKKAALLRREISI